MNRILATLFVAFGLVLGLADAVQAKPKVVALTPIEGDSNGSIGEAVSEALDGNDVTVLAPKAVTRAIDKLGYDGELSDKQAKKLASELEADAVIQATLDRDGKRKVLQFKLLVDGKKARGFKVTFNNAASQNFKVKLRDKVVERLRGESEEPAEVKPPPDEGDEDADEGHKKKLKKAARSESDEADEDDDKKTKKAKKTKKKKKKKASDDEDADAEEPTGDEEEDIDEAVSRVSPHAANRVAVRLDVGVSVQNRTLAFTQRSNFPEGPKPYSNAPVPGARVEGEIYPFAFVNPKSPAAGFGLAGEYDKTLSLTLNTSAEPGTPVKATQKHWSLGVRYRIPFGSKPMSPTVTLGAGIGSRTFRSDRSVLMNAASLDVPDTRYKLYDPGLMFRIPVAPVVALVVGGKALIITDAGPIQQPESYGRAKVFGASAQAGVDIVVANRFAIRVVGEFLQVGFSFTGTGAMANARDRDPMTRDVGGASDRSIGGAVTLGVLY